MDGAETMEHHAAQRAVLELVRTGPVTDVPLRAALGHVLAHDVVTQVDQPPFDNSAMDGYAVRAADVAAVPVLLDVVTTSSAGHPSSVRLAPGQAARILTGAVMVDGADSVVPVEHTDGGTDQVRVLRTPTHGAHVRRAGEGCRRGDVVLRAGTRLHPGHLGVAAGAGVGHLGVVRAPRVALVSTGDELVGVAATLGPGQLHESNSVVLEALLHRAGAEVSVHHAPDDAEHLRDLLPRLGADHDVVLSTGGVSMGAEFDAVRVAIADEAVRVVALDIRPAKPLAFGTVGDALFVGLPGNPVSAVVSFELFVRPALRRLAGIEPALPPTAHGPAGEQLTHPGGAATHYLRVRRGDTGWVRTGHGGSHLLGGLADADALAVLPPGADVAPGEDVALRALWS
jgi:molybdopterin molybdotransferase